MIVRVVSFVVPVERLVLSFCRYVWVRVIPGIFRLVVFVWGVFLGSVLYCGVLGVGVVKIVLCWVVSIGVV